MIYVIALYADRSGCGDYRVRFPALAVNKRDVELHVHIEVSDHIPADATYDTNTSKYHIRRVDVPRGVKVVSFQRPLKAVMAGAIMWLHEHRPDIAIVVDLDDDLAGVPTSNTAYAAVHPKASPQENYQWLRQAIALADVFTCSTPDIAERYGYDRNRTVIIRNGIPSHMLDQPARTMAKHRERSDGSDRIIGWAGHIGTHNGDLDVTCNALADVVGADRTDGRRVTFRNIGPREGVAQALGLQESDVSATGWLKPPLYRLALSELDIGIVPLADTRFNRAKSALKVLEFAAAGVPVIASYTPEHVRLRDMGLPIWLVKPARKHWVKALRSLVELDNDELRDLAIAHREFVRRTETMESRAVEWAGAFRLAARVSRELTTAKVITEQSVRKVVGKS